MWSGTLGSPTAPKRAAELCIVSAHQCLIICSERGIQSSQFVQTVVGDVFSVFFIIFSSPWEGVEFDIECPKSLG